MSIVFYYVCDCVLFTFVLLCMVTLLLRCWCDIVAVLLLVVLVMVVVDLGTVQGVRFYCLLLLCGVGWVLGLIL